MNDLTERYLAAVGRELPEKQRADIVAELRDELLSTIEAKEDGLGRTLSEKELVAELRAFGHPLAVAGRYRKVQHLIGPDVFPFWWAGLRAALIVVTAIYATIFVLTVVGAGRMSSDLDGMIPDLSWALVTTFGAVTLFCMAMERWGKAGALSRWSPAQLPPAGEKTRSRFELVFEIIGGVVMLAWWFGLFRFRDVAPSGDVRLELAPVWQAWFWPIALYFAYELAANVLALVRPGRVALNRILSAVRYLVVAGITAGVLQADQLILVTVSARTPEEALRVHNLFETGARVGLIAMVPMFIWLAGIELWRLSRQPGRAPRAAAA
ncbi:MAG: hypothetical protein DI570_00480 [Phenylobacterium zucineum]|nr:MAG: hypothetical protein DI570_00480 [Phenylobacterium zucineum]